MTGTTTFSGNVATGGAGGVTSTTGMLGGNGGIAFGGALYNTDVQLRRQVSNASSDSNTATGGAGGATNSSATLTGGGGTGGNAFGGGVYNDRQ